MAFRKRFCMVAGVVSAIAIAATLCGCASLGSPFQYSGNPVGTSNFGSSGQSGPIGTVSGSGGTASGNDRSAVDACELADNRKFVRISMRNLSNTYVHYFFVAIAFIQPTETTDGYIDGAVCPDDVDLYTAFGYTRVGAGQLFEFGNYCFQGPCLVYFHRTGQFQRGGSGTQSLASAIAPASGPSAPAYDNFFTSTGAAVPVPDFIMFHNPGTGQGARLKISRNQSSPCSEQSAVPGAPNCQQDAFYYVTESDLLDGSTALGAGSSRRVPSEIQGSQCECIGSNDPWQVLAPDGVSGANAECFEFLRGGRIDYVFVRDDVDPPYPQLLWRVTDGNGSVAHNYDPDSSVP
jgi:hypothetical protein